MYTVKLIYAGAEALWGAATPEEWQTHTIRRGVVLATKQFRFRWMVRAYKSQVASLSDGNPQLMALTQEEIDARLGVKNDDAV